MPWSNTSTTQTSFLMALDRLVLQSHHPSRTLMETWASLMTTTTLYLSLVMSRTGFPTQLKCKKVGIDKEKTSRVIVREKLSKRAVVKEDGLGQVYLQERRLTPIGT